MQTNIAKRRSSMVFKLCTHSARPPGYWRWCFRQRWKPDRKQAQWRRSDLPWWQTHSPWLPPAGFRLLPTWQSSKIEQMFKVLWKALRGLFQWWIQVWNTMNVFTLSLDWSLWINANKQLLKVKKLIQFLSFSVTCFTLYSLTYSLKSYKNIVQLDAIHIYTQ